MQDPPYFITAYEIAVKHGFRGSERDWLRFLKTVGIVDSIKLRSSTEGSDKVFLLTVDDTGTITATEMQ